ncbi:sialate O-acetylesterase [Novipirellula artificiosorum]|uniref:Sialate O-acetylesterase domain-containing protein n=1 Tax=Novipirellula artificiosorum TaxID=2528016 RepID=A0A5C6D7W0_9BACT|nr:sialate O-acetylesterase [Novipirellula artificiosorum]TWU31316.1 hypothetical protein Poly41_61850 [Novipirellula artificiosorum]
MKRRTLRPGLSPLVSAIVVLSCLLGSDAFAEVRLPSIFNDHMVIQQQMPIRVWGWADPGETVEVSLGDNHFDANADSSGRWQVELPAMPAGKTPLTLVAKGSNTVEIKDILIGEVWLCSGQSNMEWTVRNCSNGADEVAAAQYPMIRHIKIPRNPNMLPQEEVEATWEICSPETAGNFTACGYFMARELQKELDVPVGLVNASWGGTRVEPWTPPIGFQKVEALQDIYQSVVGRTPGTAQYENRLQTHVAALEAWLTKATKALNTSELLEPSPSYPAELTPFTSHQDPTMLYNGMLHMLVGFPIRGAIWYQGESNHNEGMLYFEKKKALIQGWRELWGEGDFPFYYVQIAPYQYGTEDPAILADFWEAQAAVQQLPSTGMVVINDIATLDNIHPPNKQDVGKRLAMLALKNDYGRETLVANSPELESLDVLDGSLRVNFKNTGGGLKTRDRKAPSHFEIIGPGSSGFHAATARIDGDSIVLTADEVKNPVAFRFAWHKLAEPNLTGGTGLPVGALRAGELPDFLSQLPIGTDYKLVYDLDLSKLAKEVRYDVDNSGTVDSFERIGYLLELTTAGGEEQKVFVSMDAFTDNVKTIAIPTFSSKANYQQNIESMDVYSTVSGVTTGTGITTGNIEFWPNNYSAVSGSEVKGASSSVFDFGDKPGPPVDGYGSMQVHNYGEKQTLFAINHWGANADIGIGNSEGNTRDWTFAGNAASYTSKRLRVYVK